MHNIKLLREKPDFFKKKFQDRNIKLNINKEINNILLYNVNTRVKG